MTTPAQIAANRRNARKSTGPRTEAGKEVSAGNALRHGLTSRLLACEDERGADFVQFAEALRRDLAPMDEVEKQLAERVILSAWRLRRAARAERAIIDSWPASTSPSTHLLHAENGMSRLFVKRPESMLALSRYEAALDRAFTRALSLLERRQARRRGEPVLAPVTVLVESAESAADDDANRLVQQAKNENCETNPIAVAAPDIARDASIASGE
jgi:hypothetical protein